MSNIKNRKVLKKEFEDLAQRYNPSMTKKTFTIKDFKKFDEIIAKTPLKLLDSKLKSFIDSVYERKRKLFIGMQAFGLFLIVTLSAVIYFKLIQVTQLWTFIWFAISVLAYLILDNIAYRNTKKTLGKLYELIESSKKGK